METRFDIWKKDMEDLIKSHDFISPKNVDVNGKTMFKGIEATLIYDAKDKSAAQKTVKVKKNGKLKIDVLAEGGALLISK